MSHGTISSSGSDHPEAHTVASHSDTTATGTELETLTDGSNADSLHAHASPSHTIASHSDTTATGSELETLTDGSNADSLHSHSGGGDPLTTKGDLFTFDSDAQRLPVGSNGELLSANSAETTGLEWVSAPSGTVPTPSDTDETLVPNSGATAYVSYKSRGEHIGTHHSGGGAPWDGSTNAAPAMRAAQAAIAAAGGKVICPPGSYLMHTTETVDSLAVACHFQERQYLEGAGHGSARARTSQFAPTEFLFDDTSSAMDAMFFWRANDGSPKWAGGGAYGFHIGDVSTGNDGLKMGIACEAINNLSFHHLSFGPMQNEDSEAAAFKIYEANAGQATQYGELYSFDIADCYRGIYSKLHNPDWIIHHGKIQKDADVFWPNSEWIRWEGSKVDFADLAIQFGDYGILLDGTVDPSDRAKHCGVGPNIHFEGDAGARTVDSTVTSSHPPGTQLTDTTGTFTSGPAVEVGQPIFNVTDGSKAYVTSVDSAIQLTHTALTGGTDDDWTSGDTYDLRGYTSALEIVGTNNGEIPFVERLDIGQRATYQHIVRLEDVDDFQGRWIRIRGSALMLTSDNRFVTAGTVTGKLDGTTI